ncbi:MAG: hypothetical protein MI864_04200 [Pseudomonadales bacterium]|nr:hypothetical protein [Pseudomonadales bacterium]
MEMAELIVQPLGVGSPRQLSEVEKEHIVCLLRAIERLPLLSQQVVDRVESKGSYETLCRCLEGIHRNHVELSQYATAVLTDEKKRE